MITCVNNHRDTGMKRKITERALAARLGRHLAKRNEVLRKCAPQTRGFLDLGEYYIVNLKMNSIIDTDINLQALARDEGVLKAWEELGEVK